MEDNNNIENNNVENNNLNPHVNNAMNEQEILDTFSDIIDGPEREYFKLAVGVDGKWYPSDACLKENIEDNNCGLAEINRLNIKSYTYKKDRNKTPQVGVIAQDLYQIFPNSVKEDENGNLMVRRDEMFFAMINSIKELSNEVKSLKAEIAEIKKSNR